MAPTHLCIVSRDPLRSGVLVAALKTALSPRDKLEIIVDRRRGGSATDRPSVERRHYPHFTHALEREGFVIVPTRPAQLAEHSIPAALPIERLDPQDADEHELKRILEYIRRRKVRLSRWVILTGLMGVILVLLVLLPAVRTLIGRPVAPPPSDDRMNTPSAVALVPQVAETPSPKPSRAPATTTRPAARIGRTTRGAAAASASAPPSAERQGQPRATPGQATAPEPQWNDADDPRAVVDWLFNR